MSYRKLTIDGTVYEYMIGKTHVKVRGLGVCPRTEIDEVIFDEDKNEEYSIVTPSAIVNFIKKGLFK